MVEGEKHNFMKTYNPGKNKMDQSEKETYWEIFDYEKEMFFGLQEINRKKLNAIVDNQVMNPKLLTNAIVESKLLHLRILIEIIINEDNRYPDNIKLGSLIDNLEDQKDLLDARKDLNASYGNGKDKKSPRSKINKRLMHPAMCRGESYDYDDVIEELRPTLVKVICLIERYRPNKKENLSTSDSKVNTNPTGFNSTTVVVIQPMEILDKEENSKPNRNLLI